MEKQIKILVVDDEPIIRDSLHDWLTDAGHEVLTAENSKQALEVIRRENPGIAVVDLMLPEADGLELLKRARQISPNIQVVIITAYGSVPTAIAAMKEGAYDYIEKPFSPKKVELMIEKMVERQSLLEENISLRQKLEDKYSFENIVTKSSSMQKIIEMVKIVARSNAPVLISGESGSGKEMVARAIHHQSDRRGRPFMAVSCAGLPENLLESELFGHEGVGLNGAYIHRKGKLETANRGTLFMDEVGNLNPNLQVHLLRVIEEEAFTPVGGNEQIPVDVRLISATNKDIKRSIEAGQFLEDLYYRLSVVNIDLPPLRERKEDIPVLAEFFLRKFNEENQKKLSGFSSEAIDFLLKYEWPGNVRELENAVERATILAKSDYIEVPDLSQQSLNLPRKTAIGKTLRDVEKNHILSILIEVNGNCSEASRVLGISRMTLYNKIRAYELNIKKTGNR